MTKVTAIPVAQRLGLSRAESAEYLGISPSLFDAMVDDGRMPPPKLINSRKVWPRPAVEQAFLALPEAVQECAKEADIWGDVAA